MLRPLAVSRFVLFSSNAGAGGWLLLIFFLAASLASTASYIDSPSVSRGVIWFRDGGLVLNTVEQMLHGKHLYSDLFYQYGPLPITSYWLWAMAFGNSISSLYSFLLPILIAKYLLLFKILQNSSLSLLATVATFVMVTFSVLSPFTLPEASLYIPFEETLSLFVILLWCPISKRGPWSSLLLGAAVGGFQWIRFGAAAGFVAGILAADLLDMKSGTLRSYLKNLGLFLAGIAALELLLAFYLSLTQPVDVARETLWPSYMLGAYDSFASVDRVPHFFGLKYFAGTQLPAIIGAILALAGLAWNLKAGATPRGAALRLTIPLITFVFNSLFFYKQVWHYYIGSWMLCLAGFPLLDRITAPIRLTLVILILPGVFISLRNVRPKAPSPDVATLLPNGERLWLPQSTGAANQSLVDALNQIPSDHSRQGVLFASRTPPTYSSHFYFFYKLVQPARHSMLFDGWLRPADFDHLKNTLGRSKAIVFAREGTEPPPSLDACSWGSHLYPRPFCDLISQQLQTPLNIDNVYWIFPIATPTGTNR